MNKFSITRAGILIIATFLIFSLIPSTADARLVPCGEPDNPCRLCHLFVMFGLIVDMIVWRIVPIIATIMIIYAGIRFLTAMGNPSELEKAKKMFIGIFAGFLIIVLAWSLTVALYTAMGAGTPRGWWNIQGC